jgi:hypothetical protein
VVRGGRREIAALSRLTCFRPFMRRQLSAYIDPEATPTHRKLARILERESTRKRSLSQAILDALLDYFGLGASPRAISRLHDPAFDDDVP